ncbi:MAG: cytochrome c biogenesis protein CcdA, partial [bacterium]|nr:cytochrome c biogenesis protein CcdA [bacterium]
RQVEKTFSLPVLLLSKEGEGGFSFEEGIVAYGLAFVGGILADFTPCVLPLIPLTLAFIGIRQGSRKHRFLLSLILVGGMALSYATLGILASIIGLSLSFLFQNSWFLLFFSLFFILMALSMFGLFTIQLPSSLQSRLSRMGGKGYWGSLIAGVTLGILATPCVGPIIGALLLYVAQSQNIFRGFSLLLLFGLGMGIPIILTGLFYETIAPRFRGGKLGDWLKKILGLLLLIPALYYGSIAWHSIRSKGNESPPLFHSNLPWLFEVEAGLEKAHTEGKPVLIDFSAAWCLPCLELEKNVFSNPAVQKSLQDFVLIKVDCTDETDQCREAVERYQVIGWPTILFLTPEGKVLEGETLIGVVPEIDPFVKKMERIKALTLSKELR